MYKYPVTNLHREIFQDYDIGNKNRIPRLIPNTDTRFGIHFPHLKIPFLGFVTWDLVLSRCVEAGNCSFPSEDESGFIRFPMFACWDLFKYV